MNKNLITELIKRGWEEGHECYYTRIGDIIVFYNIEVNTFSFSYDNNSPEEYLGEGSLELLEEIEILKSGEIVEIVNDEYDYQAIWFDDGRWYYKYQNCFSDTCNCVSHDRFITENVPGRFVFNLLMMS